MFFVFMHVVLESAVCPPFLLFCMWLMCSWFNFDFYVSSGCCWERCSQWSIWCCWVAVVDEKEIIKMLPFSRIGSARVEVV